MKVLIIGLGSMGNRRTALIRSITLTWTSWVCDHDANRGEMQQSSFN